MNEIKTIGAQAIDVKPRSALDVQADVNLIQEVMRSVMKVDTHYGKIKGCGDKMTLFKAGAEKIASAFRFVNTLEVEDLSGLDVARYRVTVNLQAANGAFLGSGVGECSSNEEKYKWRFAVCLGEYEDAKPNKRRKKWKKGWNGEKDSQINQIRTEPADQANTILKMAKKRAFIDAVLTVTAASDIFTQDIEDLPPEYIAPHQEAQPKAPATMPEYSAADFEKNLPLWKGLIENKTKTADQILAMLLTKFTLTQDQINKIKGV